uniref:Nucleoprotein n=2 Tax=Bovine torovirus TaxID=74501 RepID=NCAP_BRV1|nr:RecName: Full=Nucleoprotein; AltName: Full=Nucleocapsid protein; Short=NC; Short=Protein N [Breda virus serotype 1]AAD03843.1 nucleocapsid protein [Breda virus]
MNSMLNPNAVPCQPSPQVVAIPMQYPSGFSPGFRRQRNPGFRPMFNRRRNNNGNQNRGRQNRQRVQNNNRGNIRNRQNNGQRGNRRQYNQPSPNVPFEQQLLMMANETAYAATYPPEMQNVAPTKLVKIAKRAAMQIVSGHATVEISNGTEDSNKRVATFTIKVVMN